MVRRSDNILSPEMIRNRRGFTLFEMCVTLIIYGLIFASASALYTVHQKAHYLDVVAQRQTEIRNALMNYFYMQGALPCVADPSLPETDPNYGTSVTGCTVPPYLPPPNVVRTSLNSARLPPLAHPNVWIGAVPARTLGLPDSDMAEPTGHLFIYAVTESMTPASYSYLPSSHPDQSLGAIDVRTPSTGASLLASTPFGAGSALYVVISPGTDGKGAWMTNGAYPSPCASAPPYEQENCNGDTIFNGGNRSTYSAGATPTHFEDITQYSITVNPNTQPPCPAGTAATFNGTAWSCTNILLPAFTCPPTQHLYSFDAAGVPLCN